MVRFRVLCGDFLLPNSAPYLENRLPDGLPIAPELLTKWYRLWRAEHPEFEQIVFHGLRHSYSQDLTPAASQPRQNEKPAATKISGKEILEAVRLMDADERRELTRALFA